MRAVDGVGREGVSAAQTVVADRTAPTVTLALVESDPYVHTDGLTVYYGPYTGTYTVTATLAGGTAGLAEVVFPATTGPGAVYGLSGVTAVVRSHVYPFTPASAYSGTVPVTATDRATNASVRTFTVERDATPPQVWLSAPAGVISGAFTVTWGAVDAQAGVAWYDLDVSVDGGPWQRVLARTPIINYQHTNPPNTHVTFRVTATDHASNNAVLGTYAETAAGRTYTFPARSVRYVRDYLNGSNKNSGRTGAAALRPYWRSRYGASAPRSTSGRTTRRTSRGTPRRATTPWVGGGLRRGAPVWYTTCTPTIWAAHP